MIECHLWIHLFWNWSNPLVFPFSGTMDLLFDFESIYFRLYFLLCWYHRFSILAELISAILFIKVSLKNHLQSWKFLFSFQDIRILFNRILLWICFDMHFLLVLKELSFQNLNFLKSLLQLCSLLNHVSHLLLKVN